jgi:hypothetical protein
MSAPGTPAQIRPAPGDFSRLSDRLALDVDDRLALDVVPELPGERIPVKLLAIAGGSLGNGLVGALAALSVGAVGAAGAPAVPEHVTKVVADGGDAQQGQHERRKER